MTHLLAVDGNSLAHRAFHATAPEDRDGAFLTGGLVRMIASTWIEGPFDAILVGFDDPGRNRRRELFAGYKAHREDKGPVLEKALAELPGHLEACGLQVASADGAEADDLLAAAARQVTRQGLTCAVMSSDRDLLALVSPAVSLLRPRGSMARLKAYRPADVVAEYGVRPDQYTQLAALRGDTSDGLEGVGGVGPKTAARLLRDYDSIAGIYAALDCLPPRLEAALRRDRGRVERNLELMAPLEDVEVDLAASIERGIDLEVIEQALGGLQLSATAAMLRRMVTSPPPPLPPPPDDPPSVAAPGQPVASMDRQLTPVAAVSHPGRPTPAQAAEQASLF